MDFDRCRRALPRHGGITDAKGDSLVCFCVVMDYVVPTFSAPFVNLNQGKCPMPFHPVLITIAGALTLVGCGSSTSASKANFAKAINVPLGKDCINLNPASAGPLMTIASYPLALPLDQGGEMIDAARVKASNDHKFGPFDALVKAGLLTSTDAQVKAMFGNKQVPGKIYSLTTEGKAALQRPDYVAFCAGHYKVGEVVNYSVPGKAIDGTTGSEVNFTYTPGDLPSWATSEAIRARFPSFYKTVTMSQPQKGRARLVLMSDGWQASIQSMQGSGY